MLTSLFPIGDDNSDRHITPWVTFLLIGINLLVFIFLQLPSDAFTYSFSVIPAEILSGRDLAGNLRVAGGVIPLGPSPEPVYFTIFSAMFMHGGWAHLLGNMLYLWIFGDNVEDAMGHLKFLLFYLLCGIIASLAHVWASRMSGGLNLYIPSLGASGAIAGVLGGYLILYPTRSVRVLVGYLGIIAVPAVLVIGLWIALQVFSGIGDLRPVTQQTDPQGGGVAYWAHIGGAVAGLLLVWFFRDPQGRARARDRAMMAPGRGYYGY